MRGPDYFLGVSRLTAEKRLYVQQDHGSRVRERNSSQVTSNFSLLFLMARRTSALVFLAGLGGGPGEPAGSGYRPVVRRRIRLPASRPAPPLVSWHLQSLSWWDNPTRTTNCQGPLIRQRKPRGKFAHPLPHFADGIKILDVEQDLADHVGDGGHLGFLHAAGGDGGRSEADAAGLER